MSVASWDDEKLLNYVDCHGSDLSEWEIEFVSSLCDQRDHWGGRFRLTETQGEKLEEVYEDRCG